MEIISAEIHQKKLFRVVNGKAKEIMDDYERRHAAYLTEIKKLEERFMADHYLIGHYDALLGFAFKKEGFVESELRQAGFVRLSKYAVDFHSNLDLDTDTYEYFRLNQRDNPGARMHHAIEKIRWELGYRDHLGIDLLQLLKGQYEFEKVFRRCGFSFKISCFSKVEKIKIAHPNQSETAEYAWIVSHHKEAPMNPIEGLVPIKLSEYYQLQGL